ncbi:hypothetical protein ACFV1F_16830 [Streptomyces sp. NPDC059590]|uniref:hypothetical protein n=1 Tax=Streptomyces sp. NPDC059590 TaxID=3346877 RepID=UPI0036A7979A
MALNILGILDAVVSHAMASGWFEQVNQHEPKNAPGLGLTAAVWVDRVDTVRSSGLDSTSVRLLLNVRLYTSAEQEPADAIDPNLMTALDALMRAYVGDFTLGGLVREVDVRGTHGIGLEARAGYLQQDAALLRVMTIALPVIVNDLWDEVA